MDHDIPIMRLQLQRRSEVCRSSVELTELGIVVATVLQRLDVLRPLFQVSRIGGDSRRLVAGEVERDAALVSVCRVAGIAFMNERPDHEQYGIRDHDTQDKRNSPLSAPFCPPFAGVIFIVEHESPNVAANAGY